MVKTISTSTIMVAPTNKTTDAPSSGGGSSGGNTGSPATTTTTTTTTIPVVCLNSGNVTAEITSATDGGYRTTGTSSGRDYYYMRNVQGVIRNSSGVSISVTNFSLAGNLLRHGAVDQTQTVGVANNVSISPGGTYGWSVSYEALGHRNVWSDYSNVVRNETVQTLSFVSSDSRCP